MSKRALPFRVCGGAGPAKPLLEDSLTDLTSGSLVTEALD